jgi:hypothetical protein
LLRQFVPSSARACTRVYGRPRQARPAAPENLHIDVRSQRDEASENINLVRQHIAGVVNGRPLQVRPREGAAAACRRHAYAALQRQKPASGEARAASHPLLVKRRVENIRGWAGQCPRNVFAEEKRNALLRSGCGRTNVRGGSTCSCEACMLGSYYYS